jgi:hypothetical protein
LKIFLYCHVALVLAVAAAVSIGYGPTLHRWGDQGIASMFAAAAICLSVALLPALLMAVIAAQRPVHIGQAAFAGTMIRLLLAMPLLIAYQVFARPQVESFMYWATVLYLLLLAIETPFAVLAVRRFYCATPRPREGPAS